MALSTVAFSGVLIFASPNLGNDIAMTPVLDCKPSCLGVGIENRKFPKVVMKGRKKVFDPESHGLPRVSCTFRNLFCTGATPFAPVQEAFRSLGPNDLLHPLLSTFGIFPICDPLSQAAWFAILVCLHSHLSAPLVHLQEHEHPI